MPDPSRSEPSKSVRSKPLLERDDLSPRDRNRIGLAASALLGAGLVATAAIGWLAIWHLVRRGRLIRERLDPPKVVQLLDFPSTDSPPTETT